MKSARIALRQLIYDYNFFQVSTIDAFFQSILRTFAREADLAGNYEVDLANPTCLTRSSSTPAPKTPVSSSNG